MADDHEKEGTLALLAHDLRSPLSAMRMTADLIQSEALSPNQKEHLQTLIRSIDVLMDMAGDLVARAQGDVECHQKDSTVDQAIMEIVDLFQIVARNKGLSLKSEILESAKNNCISNATALRRIVTTLLDNAIKYTPKGGVVVSLKPLGNNQSQEVGDKKEGWARLSIKDSGPGIDESERGALFRPFVRGRSGLETGAGSGLGLWGVSQLVDTLEGAVWLDTPPDGGCDFIVDFPVKKVTRHQGPKISDQESNQSHSDSEIQGMRVLIVDDNETSRRVLAAMLGSFGVDFELATSGDEALKLAALSKFDVILIDLHMPDISGIETAQRLRSNKIGEHVPLIAMTAAVKPEIDNSFSRDVLKKPFSPQKLYSVLLDNISAS